MILDRLIAATIMILVLIYGNNDARAFAGAGIYFYLLGRSAEFKNYNSFINHIVFRFFGGLGVLMFIIDKQDESSRLANGIFVLFSFLIVLSLIFINVRKLKLDKKFNRREEIKESILIF